VELVFTGSLIDHVHYKDGGLMPGREGGRVSLCKVVVSHNSPPSFLFSNHQNHGGKEPGRSTVN